MTLGHCRYLVKTADGFTVVLKIDLLRINTLGESNKLYTLESVSWLHCNYFLALVCGLLRTLFLISLAYTGTENRLANYLEEVI